MKNFLIVLNTSSLPNLFNGNSSLSNHFSPSHHRSLQHQQYQSKQPAEIMEIQSRAQSSPRPRSSRKKGRKKDSDRGRLDDVKLINFHEHPPRHSFLKELALQLDRIANGVKSAIIYSYATSIPSNFDRQHAPDDLRGDENLLKRLETFYNLRTTRKCPVNYEDEATGSKKRCPTLSRGIADIIGHQTNHHRRPCYYLCLKSDCLAAFSKICNAKRHVEKIHPRDCYEKTAVDEGKKRKKKTRESSDSDDTHTSDENRSQELRRVREGQVAKRSTQRKRARVRDRHGTDDHVMVTPVVAEDMANRMRLSRGVKLKAQSEVSFMDTGDVLLTVTPAKGAKVDAESSQSKLVGCRFEDIVTKNEELKEWVATTALLKIAYHPNKVLYKFKKRK